MWWSTSRWAGRRREHGRRWCSPGHHRERWCGPGEGPGRYARWVPAGNPAGPEPADNVRDQVVRTINAVRTRLRGTGGEPDGDETTADAQDAGNGDGDGDGARSTEDRPT